MEKKKSMRRFLALLVTRGLQIKIVMRNRDTVNRITKKSDCVDSSQGCDRTGILTQIWMLGGHKTTQPGGNELSCSFSRC